ncbi:unnamed protein product, partial [marine sediment metagenome]
MLDPKTPPKVQVMVGMMLDKAGVKKGDIKKPKTFEGPKPKETKFSPKEGEFEQGVVTPEGKVIIPGQKKPVKKTAKDLFTKAQTEQTDFEREDIEGGKKRRGEGITDKRLRQAGVDQRTKKNLAKKEKTKKEELREDLDKKSKAGLRRNKEKKAVKSLIIDFRKTQKQGLKFDDSIIGPMISTLESTEAKDKLGRIFTEIVKYNDQFPGGTEFAEKNPKAAGLYGLTQQPKEIKGEVEKPVEKIVDEKITSPKEKPAKDSD